MKLNGILGKGSGKLGSSVFAISGGEQVVREYNPNVTNPNTDAQINQRAKFKLMSQIAADLASVIVIPKDGLVSARNKFVSKNIGLVEAANGEASVNYVELQLTASESAFPAVTGSIGDGGVLSVELAKMPAADVQKVVYCIFDKDDTNQLSLIGTTIIDRADASGNFATTFENAGDAYVVYAYGIKASAVAANPNYDNYVIAGATDIARLVASRSLSLDASGTTRTSGVLVAADAIRVLSVTIPSTEGDTYTPGEVAGPFRLLNGESAIVALSKHVDFNNVSNASMQYNVDGATETMALVPDGDNDKKLTLKVSNEEPIDDMYVTRISFDVEGYTYSIEFAQP